MKKVIKAFAAFLFVVLGVVSVHAGEKGKEAALGGYCPVAYVKMGKAVKGDARYSSEYQGRLYHFAGPEAKEMFDADPGKFRVAYDGWCATAIAMGKKLESDPEIFTVHHGVTYLFSSAEAKAVFDKDPAMTVAKADSNWAKLR